MARARVLDRQAHETEEVEAARAEVSGRGFTIQECSLSPANVLGLGRCEGARGCCWAVLQQLRGLQHALKDTSMLLMNWERVVLGKHVTTGGENSLDPRLYTNLLTC